MTMQEAIQKLDSFFAYRIEKMANGYGYAVTIWDEYSLSSYVEDEDLEIAVQRAILKFVNGERL